MSAQKGTGLTLVGAVGKKTDYKLRSALVTIGSDPNNEVVIEEPTVSRRHAEVTKRSGVFQIRDLGSTNVTFVTIWCAPRGSLAQSRAQARQRAAKALSPFAILGDLLAED